MRVADYIVEFLSTRGTQKVFAITGASDIRILDAVQSHPQIDYICPHHEQAGVMAAIAYHRVSGKPGVMLVTAGPGATNTVTGIASAFLDSIPLIVIGGQEKSEFLASTNHLRGKGIQGLDMVSILTPITKYVVCIKDPKEIRFHLEKAWDEAYSGRPGPVWVEVPQDVQTVEIEPDKLRSFHPVSRYADLSLEAIATMDLMKASQRPLFLVGHGVRLSHSENEFMELLNRFEAPCLTSWQAADLIPSDHPLYAGRAGIYGQRAANFALQNCDLLICLGTRLAIPQLGYSEKEFARAAKKIVVEIDPTEIEKFKIRPDVIALGDVGIFIKSLLRLLPKKKGSLSDSLQGSSPFQSWISTCQQWQKKYPPCLPEYKDTPIGLVNSYYFIDRLSEELDSTDVIVTDMGTSLTCTHATIRLKKGQRLLTSTGLGEMGFGLPAAIGACFGNSQKKTVFIGVEGSLMMNLQELQTVIHHQLPIKMFILNNNGYLTIKHTERALFGDRLSGCGPETGVSFPDLRRVSEAFGFTFFKIEDSTQVQSMIRQILDTHGPVFCEVRMPDDQLLIPKSAVNIRSDGTIYSPPLEDLFPFLSREELKSNMLIPLLHEESTS